MPSIPVTKLNIPYKKTECTFVSILAYYAVFAAMKTASCAKILANKLNNNKSREL